MSSAPAALFQEADRQRAAAPRRAGRHRGKRSSSGTGGGTGGSSSSGGAGGACANVTACGGNVVGTWTVASSCLSVSRSAGSVEFLWLRMLVRSGHRVPPGVRNVERQVRRDVYGQHDDHGQRAARVGGCVPELLGDDHHMRYGLLSCPSSHGLFRGQLYIRCRWWVQLLGHGQSVWGDWRGIRFRVTSGNYSASGNTLTIDSSTPYSYCVSGGKLTLTPQAPTMGTVVLQGGGTSTTGSGGATGRLRRSWRSGWRRAGRRRVRGGAMGGRGGAGGLTGIAGTSGAGGSTGAFQGPCDI